MGSVGDGYDNALVKSFFATLECELLQRSCFQSQSQAKRALFEYIEGWYNPHRRHSRLGAEVSDGVREMSPTRRMSSQVVYCPLNRINSNISGSDHAN